MKLVISIDIPDAHVPLIGQVFRENYDEDETFVGTTKELVKKVCAKRTIQFIASHVRSKEAKVHKDNFSPTDLGIASE